MHGHAMAPDARFDCQGIYEDKPHSQESLQYLCSKYSGLISRLREEVIARQQAETELRTLERQSRDAANLRDAERLRWEEERQRLMEQLVELRAAHRDVEDLRIAEVDELRRSAATSARLSVRCDHLHEACADEVHKTLQVMDQASVGNDVLLRQGEELTKLQFEHSQLHAKHRDVQEELAACREHLAKWRRTAAELEGRADTSSHARIEAEGRTRQLQEEMRSALRSASAARARESSASTSAMHRTRELQSREARLDAVRREGRKFAQRASSAERKLSQKAGVEAKASALARENKELRLRLEAECRLAEAHRCELVRTEAQAQAVACKMGEAQAEYKARESVAATSGRRAAELEGELSRARTRIEHMESDRAGSIGLAEGLRSELRSAREEHESVKRDRDRLSEELASSVNRLRRSPSVTRSGGGSSQGTEYKRRLASTEDSLARAQAEVTEERKARERCHLEAIRAGEKLRLAKVQCNQMRLKVRSLEEAELRYPSRTRRAAAPGSAGSASPDSGGLDADLLGDFELHTGFISGTGGAEGACECDGMTGLEGFDVGASGGSMPSRWRGGAAPESPGARSHSSGHCRTPAPVASDACDARAVLEFVASEDRRLAAVSRGAGASALGASIASAWEEPRVGRPSPCPASAADCVLTASASAPAGSMRLPEPAAADLSLSFAHAAAGDLRPGDAMTFGATRESARNPEPPAPAVATHTLDAELAALLAAEPRVLKLPEALRPAGQAPAEDARAWEQPLSPRP